MDTILSPDGSLASLALAAFLAATVVPLSSEAALFAVIHWHPDLFWAALVTATLSNTLGGMTNVVVGRWLAAQLDARLPAHLNEAQLQRVRRWGAPITALGWLPFVGEALCLAAGWLKLDWRAVLGWQLAGRGLRYVVIAQGSALL